MPQIGPAEILVVLLVALLVFGPKRLPEIGRQVGRGLHELKKFQDTVKGELDDVLRLGDPETTSVASTPENSTQLAANDPTRALPAAAGAAGAVAVPARPSHAPSRFRVPVSEPPAPSPSAGPQAAPAPVPAPSPNPGPTPVREPSRAPSRFRAPGPTA
jgi:TatA/E family protein of Tat protein translocase